MTLLSQLERVPLQVPLFVLLLLFAVGAFRALAILWRVRSDNKAKARALAVPTVRLPHNFDSGWDRLDEHRRTW